MTRPSWPASLPVGAVRFARRTGNFDATVRFYRDLVGLPLLFEFGPEDGPDPFAGVVFGMPEASVTFELLDAAGPVPIDAHEQLVLYLPGPQERDMVASRLREAGVEPCEQYRYWDDNDALTFRDPDGREVVLAPWIFGSAPPPARLKADRET